MSAYFHSPFRIADDPRPPPTIASATSRPSSSPSTPSARPASAATTTRRWRSWLRQFRHPDPLRLDRPGQGQGWRPRSAPPDRALRHQASSSTRPCRASTPTTARPTCSTRRSRRQACRPCSTPGRPASAPACMAAWACGSNIQPIYLDDVAADFPDMPIILAHLLPWQEALAVATHKPNVYIDSRAGRKYPADPRPLRQQPAPDHAVRLQLTILPDRWLADFDRLDIKRTCVRSSSRRTRAVCQNVTKRPRRQPGDRQQERPGPREEDHENACKLLAAASWPPSRSPPASTAGFRRPAGPPGRRPLSGASRVPAAGDRRRPRRHLIRPRVVNIGQVKQALQSSWPGRQPAAAVRRADLPSPVLTADLAFLATNPHAMGAAMTEYVVTCADCKRVQDGRRVHGRRLV